MAKGRDSAPVQGIAQRLLHFLQPAGRVGAEGGANALQLIGGDLALSDPPHVGQGSAAGEGGGLLIARQYGALQHQGAAGVVELPLFETILQPLEDLVQIGRGASLVRRRLQQRARLIDETGEQFEAAGGILGGHGAHLLAGGI